MHDCEWRVLIGSIVIAMFAGALGPRRGLTQEPRPAKQAPAANRDARVDAYGDRLPPGVLARLGTLRDFIGEGSSRVIFSADGRFVTASSEWFRPEVRLWDPASGRVVRDFKDIERFGIIPRQVAISPDITRIAVADYFQGLTDSGIGKMDPRFEARERRLQSMAITPDGKTIATGANDGSLWLWNIATGRATRQLRGLKGPIQSIAFAADGKTCAAADELDICLIELSTGQEIHRFPGPADGGIKMVAFSPDGTILASAHDQGLALWNLKNQTVWKRLGHPNGTWSVAFAPDGKTLATGDAYGATRVWDTGTGVILHKFAREILRAEEPPRIYSLVFTPDGKTLAAGTDDHFVTLWDLETGRERRRLRGHGARVNSLTLAPGGKTLASGSDDGTAVIWDLTAH